MINNWLFFAKKDVERQTCDWRTSVKNCDIIESKLEVKAYFLMLIYFLLNGVPNLLLVCAICLNY